MPGLASAGGDDKPGALWHNSTMRTCLLLVVILICPTLAAAAPATTQSAAGSLVEQGRALAQAGEHLAAIEKYQQAMAAEPRAAAAYAYMAASQLAMKMSREAQATIDQGLRQVPGDYRLIQMSGQVLLSQDKIDAAIERYQQAAGLSPAEAGTIYADLAGALAARNDPRLDGRIEAALKAAAQANPPHLDSLFNLGQSYAAAGRQEGRTYLQRYIELASALPAEQQQPQKLRLAKQMVRALDALRG